MLKALRQRTSQCREEPPVNPVSSTPSGCAREENLAITMALAISTKGG
jgi:hypothetical protein